MTGEYGGAGTLAERIETLFRTVRRPDRQQYSNEEVARACREASGETFSATYLWQLRTGRRDNPTKRHLEALAGFFQVPVAYFFDDAQGTAIAEELAFLGALRDSGVRNVALRAVNLSSDGLDTVSDLIDVIARREQGASQGRHGRRGEQDTQGRQGEQDTQVQRGEQDTSQGEPQDG